MQDATKDEKTQRPWHIYNKKPCDIYNVKCWYHLDSVDRVSKMKDVLKDKLQCIIYSIQERVKQRYIHSIQTLRCYMYNVYKNK